MNSRVHLLFEDMSLKSDYEILDYGKHKDEIKELAKKRNIKVPSKDLAFFKCKYAMVDKENLNGCILPRKEVEKALESLNSKAIDKDHLRKNTIGYWLDAKLEKDDMIAYGCFWKANFPEDYEEIQKRMSEGKMKISFEAWGDRNFNDDKTYNLTNIEFAGGALLFDTDPAFPDAEVLDFASNRVLEFAKIIEDGQSATPMEDRKIIKITTEDTTFITELPKDDGYDVERKSHTKRTVYFSDNTESITETDNQWEEKYTQAQLQEKIAQTIEENNEEFSEFLASLFEGEDLIDEDNKKIEDGKKLTYKERKNISDDDFAVVITVKNKTTGKPRKIRMFPIKDPAHVRNALARLPQATESLKKLGVSVETVKKKILKKARELNMTDLLKRHEGEVNNLMDEILKKYSKASVEELVSFLESEIKTVKDSFIAKETELAAKLQEITVRDTELSALKTEKETILKLVEDSKLLAENAKIELEKVKAEFSAIKAELDKRLAEEKAAIVKSRKDVIGDYAKDMTDEDILNDLKFENAKLKKERDEALKKVDTKGLDAGQVITQKDDATEKRDAIHARAWNKK